MSALGEAQRMRNSKFWKSGDRFSVSDAARIMSTRQRRVSDGYAKIVLHGMMRDGELKYCGDDRYVRNSLSRTLLTLPWTGDAAKLLDALDDL